MSVMIWMHLYLQIEMTLLPIRKKKDLKVNKNAWLFVVIRPLKKIRNQ